MYVLPGLVETDQHTMAANLDDAAHSSSTPIEQCKGAAKSIYYVSLYLMSVVFMLHMVSMSSKWAESFVEKAFESWAVRGPLSAVIGTRSKICKAAPYVPCDINSNKV